MSSQSRQGRGYSDLKRAIAAFGFARPGSLIKRFMACGKEECRCHSDQSSLHGPYYQWTRKINGKTVTRRLTEEQMERFACVEQGLARAGMSKRDVIRSFASVARWPRYVRFSLRHLADLAHRLRGSSAAIGRRDAAQAQSATSVINRTDAVQDTRRFRPQPFAGVPRSPYR